MRDFRSAPRTASVSGDLVQCARRLIAGRRRREFFFEPSLFADPAWDILLDLFVAEASHQDISVSSCCIAASVPQTTALRHINTLVEIGLVRRVDDPRDRRRVLLYLTPIATDAMRAYLSAEIEDLGP